MPARGCQRRADASGPLTHTRKRRKFCPAPNPCRRAHLPGFRRSLRPDGRHDSAHSPPRCSTYLPWPMIKSQPCRTSSQCPLIRGRWRPCCRRLRSLPRPFIFSSQVPEICLTAHRREAIATATVHLMQEYRCRRWPRTVEGNCHNCVEMRVYAARGFWDHGAWEGRPRTRQETED